MADLEEENLHPYHHHKLVKCETGEVYSSFGARWNCDVCGKSYDGRSEEETHKRAYHCYQCKYFDMCLDCFQGYLHPFHTHRLRPAMPQLCYPHTKGLWRCDACQTVYGSLDHKAVSMYHCSKCHIDICNTCFKGECYHVSHGNGTHPLKPIDPRIYYRCFEDWICDVCGDIGTHGDDFKLHFHCCQCEEDICNRCYMGNRHYLHQHNLVIYERSQSRKATSTIYCSECSRQLLGKTYYLCNHPNCQFYLCLNCFQSEPKPHPLHPKHVLYVTDHNQVYPESAGTWHCDNCAEKKPKNLSSLLTDREKMYHCDKCQFDLCEPCYKHGYTKPADSQIVHQWQQQQPPPSAPLQRTYVSSKEHYQRPILAKPSLKFIPSVSTIILPTPAICRTCGLRSAKVSPVHQGKPHHKAIYCEPCGETILSHGTECILCGKIPDDMFPI